MNLKPFDLEAAKKGAPIVTRDGRKAKFVAHVPECEDEHRVVVIVEGVTYPFHHNESGIFHSCINHGCDLFMAPTKREGWINIYRYSDHSGVFATSTVWPSKEAADTAQSENRIACVRVEWEEA